MAVGAVTETVTVSGQSPLVDIEATTQRRALTSELLNELPTGRSFQNIAILVPGVRCPLLSDVGGSDGARWQTMTVHGSRDDQMPLLMNGMPFNNMNNSGGGYNHTLAINTGTVQEMTITTRGRMPRQDERCRRQHGREGRRQSLHIRLLRRFLDQRPAERQPGRCPQVEGPVVGRSHQGAGGGQPDDGRPDRPGQAVVLRRVPLLEIGESTSRTRTNTKVTATILRDVSSGTDARIPIGTTWSRTRAI